MRVILLLLISHQLLIRSDAVAIALNNNWTLSNINKNISVSNITIPCGIYSDLEDAGITESLLFSYNDVELRWIGNENWTYTTEFEVTAQDLGHTHVTLIFNGLDTLTEIYLNGEWLGATENMFIRYRYDVKEILVAGINVLSIEFASAIEGAKNLNMDVPPSCPPDVYNGECHINLLRKMQASFAWDWGLAAPSVGIWKSIRLELYDSAEIRAVTYTLIEANASEDDEENIQDDSWVILISVHMETSLAAMEVDGMMSFELIGVDGSRNHEYLHLVSDEFGELTAEVNLTIVKDRVERWWPNGSGKQSLYGLRVQWEDTRINEVNYRNKTFFTSERTVNIGFRTIELVQEPIDSGLSFYFKINNIPIFMKGSNWIPASILPEKSADLEKVREILQAAKDANINMLRVWGGGVYESTTFYNLADEMGILIWQDFMFACAMYRSDEEFLDSVRLEVKLQVRRIQHHPSIAIYATNNENEVALRQNWYGTQSNFQKFAEDYHKLYSETVTDETKKHDPSRAILTSSPSNGDWKKEQEFGIALNPQDPNFGDIHFYIVDHNGWRPENYHQPRFSSEYGFQSFPSGWKDVKRSDDNLTQLIFHRQHHPLHHGPIKFMIEDNLRVDFDELDDWSDKIYLSQVSQAVAIKTETEVYRSGRGGFMNTMGALYWQLNDVWVAPSWSSIEFNGNFKILHHWVKEMFAPRTLITQFNVTNRLQIYGVSDEINAQPQEMYVKMNLYKWTSFRIVNTRNWTFVMIPNAVTLVESFDLHGYMDENKYGIYDHMAEFLLTDNEDQVISRNFAFPGYFKDVTSIGDPKPSLKITSNRCDNESHRITMEIKIQAPAIFMSIALMHDKIKKYQLSRNGFIQLEPIQVIQVTFRNPNCNSTVTEADFETKTLNQFMM